VVISIPLWNKNLKNRVSSEFVAEDIKEVYEKKWWLCCRKGNIEDMNHMLRGGGQALVAARDSDNRG